jgi:predicted nucleotidyltransferase
MNRSQINPVRDSVLTTLAWFDVFDYPLTAVEVARFSSLFATAISIAEAREVLISDPQIAESNGYYFFRGREICVTRRLRRFRSAETKFRRARLIARLFSLWPAVCLVALCNSLAMANADEESDIDLFIVCRPKTLWLTRLVLVAPLMMFGLRPVATNQKNKICLSFIISEEVLDISHLRFAGDDPYLRFWVETLVPLYDVGGIYEKFRQKNRWVAEAHRSENIQGRSDSHSSNYRLSLIERLAKRVQLFYFPPGIKALANLDSRVVISDDILKFHINDRRELYRQLFRRRLSSLLSSSV